VWSETLSNEDRAQRFAKAMELTGVEFREWPRNAVASWLPGRAVVAAALENAPQVHLSGVHAQEVNKTRRLKQWLTAWA
jgi:hypothetical protein